VGLLELELKDVASIIRPTVTLGGSLLLCVCLSTLLVGCQPTSEAEQTTKAPTEIELAPADIVLAESRTLSPSTAVSGSLQAVRSTSVQPQGAATVLSVLAEDGDRVRRGEPLVTLNTQDSQSRLAQAEANLAGANAQLILARSVRDRNAQLYNKGFVSQMEYERSAADASAQQESVKAQQAMVAISRKAVSDAVIRAPLDGVVSSRRVEPGQTVSPGQSLMEIIDPSLLELKATAPAQAQSMLHVGQQVVFSVQGLADQTFNGQINRVNPVADMMSRTLTFYARVDNPNNVLRAGLFAEGVLQHGQPKTGVALPTQAIQSNAAGQRFVWVVRDNKLTQQNVTIQSEDPISGWALVSDITAGETVAKLSLAEGARGRTVRLTP
jgi:RND family efflux transporter MFP subunit